MRGGDRDLDQYVTNHPFTGIGVMVVGAQFASTIGSWLLPDSVSVSAQDGIVALGKAHTRSAPFLSSLPKVALETVPIFVWLNTDRSRPLRVECQLI